MTSTTTVNDKNRFDDNDCDYDDDINDNVNANDCDCDDKYNWAEDQVGVLTSFSSLDTFAAILTRFSYQILF